jgi:hypothetical protein
MIEHIRNAKQSAQNKAYSLAHPPSPNTSRQNLNGGIHFTAGPSVAPLTPRSPSPSRSSSSLSTTSTHTAIPSNPRAMNGGGALTPVSRASTITPVPREREKEREQQHTSAGSRFSFTTSMPRPPPAPTIDDAESAVSSTRAPDLMTLIKNTLLPHLTAPKILFVLFAVLFPLLSFLFKVRSLRRNRVRLGGSTPKGQVGASRDAAVETRKRLESMGTGLGNNVRIRGMLTGVWRLVADTLSMAGKGLL